jgi:tripartite-type tricarboxylate transporter receptor subunit TctC
MIRFDRFRRAGGLLAAVTLALAAPLAQAWTDKPVRLIVPAPAGGTMDVIARVLAEQMQADIGQPVAIDNKPGAGGAIGVQAMNLVPADGQTLMVTVSNILTEIPHVMKTAFDPLKDVKPVVAVARSGLLFVAGPNFPASDVKGAVAYVKAHPGKVSVASYSAGTGSHYANAIFNQKAGLDLQHVPFAGSPPALQQVMGGQIDLMFDGVVTSLPLIKAGKIKVLAAGTKTRSPYLPDVPTMGEQGYPDIDIANWVGLVGPGALSAELAEKVSAAVQKAVSVPKVRERLQSLGFELITPMGPTALTQALREEYARNASIVKTFDIKLTK